MALQQTLEAFLQSKDFAEGVTSATKASWGGSGYSVELFEDGHWRVLWNSEIGNLYRSPGIILGLPTWEDSTYQECVNADENPMSEDDYFDLCAANEEDELADELRQDLKDILAAQEV